LHDVTIITIERKYCNISLIVELFNVKLPRREGGFTVPLIANANVTYICGGLNYGECSCGSDDCNCIYLYGNCGEKKLRERGWDEKTWLWFGGWI